MADYLSRHTCSEENLPEEKDYVNLILPGVIPSSLNREIIAKETSLDKTLILLTNAINQGFLLNEQHIQPFKDAFN